MKRSFYLFSIMVVFSMILMACGGTADPGAAGVDSNSTEPSSTEPAATDIPATDAPAEIIPIDLAGPAMEVGSRYTYEDGSILAAVPGGSFLMGNNNMFDTKEHEVTVGDFWIYSNEVTN